VSQAVTAVFVRATGKREAIIYGAPPIRVEPAYAQLSPGDDRGSYTQPGSGSGTEVAECSYREAYTTCQHLPIVDPSGSRSHCLDPQQVTLG